MRNRWTWILVAALLVSSSALSLRAEDASSYPSRPIKVILPFPPGGGAGIGGRIISEALGRHLGQNIIVENKPGAGGRIGAAFVAKSPADGYTLLYTPEAPVAIMQYLKLKLDYDPERDLTPVALMVTAPALLVVRQSFPAKTLAEFVAYAKMNPGKITFGIQGIGNEFHVSLERLREEAGLKIVAVPYQGGAPAIVDLLAGRLDAMFLVPAAIKKYLEAGRLRALVTLEPKRVPDFPDVPTIAEAGLPKVTGSPWFGYVAPAATPKGIIDKLAKAMVELPSDAPLVKRLDVLGYLFNPIGPAKFAALLKQQRSEFKKIAATGRLDRAN